ncbi:hypothetical protein [Desulfitobacterium chlororespirans]|uniref:hypothetical protein n=1 Tax=Desulfitobacterium chlororespirans TaxID=51616 RepID=UPI0015B58A46|nr:hypothetical protein [Desulfitobacterium chlororespirans]
MFNPIAQNPAVSRRHITPQVGHRRVLWPRLMSMVLPQTHLGVIANHRLKLPHALSTPHPRTASPGLTGLWVGPCIVQSDHSYSVSIDFGHHDRPACGDVD